MPEQHHDDQLDAPLTADAHEVLTELLLDLKHDLGKHLALPLTLLPASADDATFVATARRALTHTRHGPMGAVAANTLWERFLDELGPHRPAWDEFGMLAAAVKRACAWQPRLEAAEQGGHGSVEPGCAELGLPAIRATLMQDFRNVSECIQRLLQRARHGGA